MTITSTRPARRSRRTAGVGVAMLALLAAAASGCGDGGGPEATEATGSGTPSPTGSPSDEPTAEPSEEAGPACADIWVAGEELPTSYRGCQDGDRWVEAFVYRCESGQRLVTFRRSFYAAKGGPVVEVPGTLAKDADFQQALAACTA